MKNPVDPVSDKFCDELYDRIFDALFASAIIVIIAGIVALWSTIIFSENPNIAWDLAWKLGVFCGAVVALTGLKRRFYKPGGLARTARAISRGVWVFSQRLKASQQLDIWEKHSKTRRAVLEANRDVWSEFC